MTPDAHIPALGFGTWQLDESVCRDAVVSALDIGYRHVDTAQAYNNEHEVGRALDETGLPRSEIFLATKVWMDRLEPQPLKDSVVESLQKLRTDHVDLLYIHWPNDDVPLSETLAAMRELRDAGRIRAIGVSNFPTDHVEQAVDKIGAPVAANQVEYHPFLSQEPVLQSCRARNMALVAYSPLARGEAQDNGEIAQIASRYGKTPAQVTLRWLIQQDNVAAIPKASKAEHARANFDIFDFELDADEMARIAGLAAGHRKIDPSWAPVWDAA